MPVANKIVWSVFVFIFGSIIGSFLNVVILRTPRKESIVTEPSHCFSCGHRLAWYDLFPIFSWLFLRGKCRYCSSPISPRYMVIELITAVSYLSAFLVYGFSLELAYAAVLFAVLIALSGIDLDHFEIPYWSSITIAVLGISSIFVFHDTPWDVWYRKLIALGVVAVLFVLLVLIGGMGGGDLQLMAGASLLLGYRVFISLLIGIILGSVYGVIKKTRDKTVERETSRKIKELAEAWYSKQVERDVGIVAEGSEDIIVGSVSDGDPDIEWEFLEEKVWKGLPDKAALSQSLRENISDEREGAFRIYIKGTEVTKVKYQRRMAFGPFLAVGIAAAWLFGTNILTWYLTLIH